MVLSRRRGIAPEGGQFGSAALGVDANPEDDQVRRQTIQRAGMIKQWDSYRVACPAEVGVEGLQNRGLQDSRAERPTRPRCYVIDSQGRAERST